MFPPPRPVVGCWYWVFRRRRGSNQICMHLWQSDDWNSIGTLLTFCLLLLTLSSKNERTFYITCWTKKELMYYCHRCCPRLCGHLCPCYNCHHHHLRCRRVIIIIKNIATRGDVGDPGPEGLIGAKGEPGRDGLPGLSPIVTMRITTISILTTVTFITPKCNHSHKYINTIAME